jgi:hypothetical protein
MESIQAPTPLKLHSGNIAQEGKRFKRQFTWYLTAIDVAGANDARKVAIMLIAAGEEAQGLYETFRFAEAVPAVDAAQDRPAVAAVPAENNLHLATV